MSDKLPGFPSFTKTYHHHTYSAISPTLPGLSAKGKTVIITGAGYGSIGAAAAYSFATAGATRIALIGKNLETLAKTRATLEKEQPQSKIHCEVADITDAESGGKAAHQIRAQLGAWDVFVHCSGYVPPKSTLTGSDFDDWWRAFEVNVKFIHHFAKHFLTKCRPHSTFICTMSSSVHRPVVSQNVVSPDSASSSYSASQLAALRLIEFLAVQYPVLRVFSIYPGVDETLQDHEYHLKHGGDDEKQGLKLGGDFMVWLASLESEFLRGRFVWTNWDVDELKAKAASIERDPAMLRPTMGGWPFESDQTR